MGRDIGDETLVMSWGWVSRRVPVAWGGGGRLRYTHKHAMQRKILFEHALPTYLPRLQSSRECCPAAGEDEWAVLIERQAMQCSQPN